MNTSHSQSSDRMPELFDAILRTVSICASIARCVLYCCRALSMFMVMYMMEIGKTARCMVKVK